MCSIAGKVPNHYLADRLGLSMELRELEYFAAIARLRSFRRAADELRVAQPTLSQQIKKLERELGVSLLARNSRGVRLTEPGLVFLNGVEPALQAIDNARAEVAAFGELSGKLIVGTIAMSQYHLPAFLAAFSDEYPKVDLVARQLSHEHVWPTLASGEVHLALVQIHPTASPIPRSMRVEHLARLVVGVVLPPDHPLARQEAVHLGDLRGKRLIMPTPGSAARATVDLAMKKANFDLQVEPFETSVAASVTALVAQGLAIGLASHGLDGTPASLDSMDWGAEHLVFRQFADADMTYRFSVVWAARAMNPVVDAFIRSARGWIQRSVTQ